VATLKEYAPTPIALQPGDLNYLLSFVSGTGEPDESKFLQAITPTREQGIYLVRPGAYVGRVGLPSGAQLDLVSRFHIRRLIELIRISEEAPTVLSEVEAEASPDDLFLDLLAMAFVREVESIASRGLAKGYREVLLQEPPYGGRLDVAYHLGRLAGRPDRLAFRAKRLTLDIPINRALALALEVLLRVPLDEKVSQRLHRLRPVFRQVSTPQMSASEIRRLPLTRLTERYKNARALAALLVSSQELAFEGRGWTGGTLLFSMTRVWERYVERWVRTQWPNHRVQAQARFNVGDDGTLPSAADVLVYEGLHVKALYDAKYKSPDEAPSRSDVYQMVTYCERLGVTEATLVYPQVTDSRSVRVAGKTIRVVGLVPDPSALVPLREGAAH
jgi:5-methylcytosine-specific restriction endonuclease McrBC regulatory subunit McrC